MLGLESRPAAVHRGAERRTDRRFHSCPCRRCLSNRKSEHSSRNIIARCIFGPHADGPHFRPSPDRFGEFDRNHVHYGESRAGRPDAISWEPFGHVCRVMSRASTVTCPRAPCRLAPGSRPERRAEDRPRQATIAPIVAYRSSRAGRRASDSCGRDGEAAAIVRRSASFRRTLDRAATVILVARERGRVHGARRETVVGAGGVLVAQGRSAARAANGEAAALAGSSSYRKGVPGGANGEAAAPAESGLVSQERSASCPGGGEREAGIGSVRNADRPRVRRREREDAGDARVIFELRAIDRGAPARTGRPPRLRLHASSPRPPGADRSPGTGASRRERGTGFSARPGGCASLRGPWRRRATRSGCLP